MNIVLTGMPGSGKSTIGPILADRFGLPFLDTDNIVAKADGRALKDIVAQDGFEVFLSIQRDAILSCKPEKTVIATGGSVVTDPVLMEYFKKTGHIVYLREDFSVLERRLGPGRKLARTAGMGFRELYDMRRPLYEKYADTIVECTDCTPSEVVRQLESTLHGFDKNRHNKIGVSNN